MTIRGLATPMLTTFTTMAAPGCATAQAAILFESPGRTEARVVTLTGRRIGGLAF